MPENTDSEALGSASGCIEMGAGNFRQGWIWPDGLWVVICAGRLAVSNQGVALVTALEADRVGFRGNVLV